MSLLAVALLFFDWDVTVDGIDKGKQSSLYLIYCSHSSRFENSKKRLKKSRNSKLKQNELKIENRGIFLTRPHLFAARLQYEYGLMSTKIKRESSKVQYSNSVFLS